MLKLLSLLQTEDMDIRIIIRIDELVKRQMTGTPKKLAYQLNLSERMVYHYLNFMKSEMKAPITYRSDKQSYCYTEETGFCFVRREN